MPFHAEHALQIVGGDDAGLFDVARTYGGTSFVVSVGSGDIYFLASPDYDNPLDANGDNIYEVDVAYGNDLAQSDIAHLQIEVISFDPADNTNPALMVGDVMPIVPGTYESLEFFL